MKPPLDRRHRHRLYNIEAVLIDRRGVLREEALELHHSICESLVEKQRGAQGYLGVGERNARALSSSFLDIGLRYGF